MGIELHSMFMVISKTKKLLYEKNKKKEVIHPQVPLQIPCDDLAHLTDIKFDQIKEFGLI